MNAELRTPIYFKRHENYAKEKGRLAAWSGLQENKRLIMAYEEFLLVKGSKGVRIAKLMGQLRALCDQLPVSLSTAKKADIQTLVAWINQQARWSTVTQADYRRAVKSFYNWYEEEDERLQNDSPLLREEARKLYQYLKKHVKVAYTKRSPDYATILTPEDVKAIIERGCASSMERALVSILHETGCRVGELLGMRLCDIEYKGKYAMVAVDGKTGPRRIPFDQSIPYLRQWLQDHPAKDNPRALLWISSYNGRHYGTPLVYIGVDRLLKRVCRRAGMNKRHNAHWFRHSRATLLATQYREQILCNVMGWVVGSAQVRTYVHMGAEQVEDAFKEQKGITEHRARAELAQYCACGVTNTSSASYCYQCGNALNIGVMAQEQTATTEALDELTKILGTPERLKRLQEIIKTMEAGK